MITKLIRHTGTESQTWLYYLFNYWFRELRQANECSKSNRTTCQKSESRRAEGTNGLEVNEEQREWSGQTCNLHWVGTPLDKEHLIFLTSITLLQLRLLAALLINALTCDWKAQALQHWHRKMKSIFKLSKVRRTQVQLTESNLIEKHV